MRVNRARTAAVLTVSVGLLVVAIAAATSLYAFRHVPVSGRSADPLHHPLASHPMAADRTYVGVFEPGATASYQPVAQFAAATGVKPNIVLCYMAWGGRFELRFAERAAQNGAVPFVQWLPRGISMAAVAAGKSDNYLLSFAREVRSYGLPVILSFAPEMNGWWYPWGWTHTPPSVWVAAWRHVVTVFREQHATNVTWLWTVNRHGGRTGPVRRYWPGRQYVNWIGIDGYYFTQRETFGNIFSSTIQAVRRLSDDPLLLSETGIGQVAGQARRIPNLFAGIKKYGLLGLVWFDGAQHDGLYHQDWRLIGHPAALAAFRRGVAEIRRPRT